jgi:hypothetical protein
VLRPLRKERPKAASSEPAVAASTNTLKQHHPQRQASDDFHPDGTRFLKCRFFMMGTCAKGAKCHFMHWEPAAAPRKPHVYAAASSSSSSAANSVKLPVTAQPSSASASASKSASAKPSASIAQSPLPISTSIAPLDPKSCATTSTSLADENEHSDPDESDDEALSAGRAPLPARAPQFDGDSKIDNELYFYGAPGAQPVPAPVARVDANNPTAAVSFAKMAARNIVHAPMMASKLAAAVTTPASVVAVSGDGHASSSTRGGNEFMPFVSPPTVADPQRKPCVYFTQGFCRFGRVCVFIAPCSVSCLFFRSNSDSQFFHRCVLAHIRCVAISIQSTPHASIVTNRIPTIWPHTTRCVAVLVSLGFSFIYVQFEQVLCYFFADFLPVPH